MCHNLRCPARVANQEEQERALFLFLILLSSCLSGNMTTNNWMSIPADNSLGSFEIRNPTWILCR